VSVQARHIAEDLARRGLVRTVALTLMPLGVPVMPLKGVLFAYWLYDSPHERFRGDVDLLVPEADFERSVAALTARTFVLKPEQTGPPHERTLLAPAVPIEIDLHCALFTAGRYRLSTAEVFAHGTPDDSLFAAPVVLPDPYDAYAHVVGHEASTHMPSARAHVGRDLALLAARFDLPPGRCALHLEASGLARAARYTLGLFAPGDPFAREVLRSLSPDPVGALLVRIVRAVARRRPQTSVVARAVGHLTDRSLGGVPHAMLRAALARHRPSPARGVRRPTSTR
jgi:Uncharacterised nucleotidyltransferase